MQKFEAIPREMRNFDHWIAWRFENQGDEKPTKIPYCLISNRQASINNPNHWTSYDQAIANVGKFDGLGFVLTLTDPFCFIDFDDPFELKKDGATKFENPQEIRDRQIALHSKFDTYSEVSPGGGLHLICKANVMSGRRRDAIEIYSSSRFMTMTGDVYNATEIKFRQEQATSVWESLEGVSSNQKFSTYNEPSIQSDREIYDLAINAVNGQKFGDLWNGDIDTHHGGDHSRADFAIVDILAYYTQDRQQVTRLFRQSGLGQRSKAMRNDYVSTMITRSFDQIVPFVDISAIMSKIDDLIVNDKNAKPVSPISRSSLFETPTLQPQPQITTTKTSNVKLKSKPQVNMEQELAFELPPGITGQIADFIYKQAWKPVKQIATLGALGLMAGLAGRAYNASGSGLNLYLLMLAKTGRGKEAISKGYEKILDAVLPVMPQIGDFSGPADLASGQALLRYMSDHNTSSFVSVFGEFGPMLKRITSPTAIGADLMTQKVMLDMYSKSGRSGKIMPTAYSDAERNTKTIRSPGFSFVAESAPSWFDDNVDMGMIATGLLPRFIIAEYDGVRVPSNETGPLMYPNAALIESVCTVATCALKCFQQNTVIDIPFDYKSAESSQLLDRFCDDKINSSTDEIVSELWNRVHLNTIRVAGLIAVGNNPYKPVIDASCWQWAERFIQYNIQKLEEKFSNGTVLAIQGGETEFAEVEKLEEAITEYLISDFRKLKSYGGTYEMHRRRIIPYIYFSKRLTRLKPFSKAKIGGGNAVKRAIQNMIDNGDLQELSKAQCVKDLSSYARCFAVRSDRLLQRIKTLSRP